MKYLSPILGAGLIGLTVYFSYRIFKNIYISGVRNLERLCIEVQMKALKDYQPDIVIGMLFSSHNPHFHNILCIHTICR